MCSASSRRAASGPAGKLGPARRGVAQPADGRADPADRFGGVLGALGKAMRLKRPRLSVSIGPLIPPVPNPLDARAEGGDQEASREIMRRIRR